MKIFLLLLVFVPQFAFGQNEDFIELLKVDEDTAIKIYINSTLSETSGNRTIKAGEEPTLARLIAGACNNNGYRFMSDGKYDEAINNFDGAIEFVPEFAAAYAKRGYVWGKKGEYAKAIRDCKEAIRLDPKLLGAYDTIAWLYTNSHEPDNYLDCKKKAVAASRKACDLTKWNDHRRIHNFAAINYMWNEHDEAIRLWEKAIEVAKSKRDDTTQYEKNLKQFKISRLERILNRFSERGKNKEND